MTWQLAAPLTAIAIAIAACSSVPHGSTPRPVESCVIGNAQPKADDTLLVATTAPVDWTRVPVPANKAERFAFAQLYETLIDVDCDGRARPGLAASWTLDATKSRITIAIRPGAMFWSGKPVTANDVLAAWRRTAAQSIASGNLAREIVNGATIIDDHTLLVSLPDTAWLVLSSPELAVYEQQATALWPEGSGPYRIAEQSAQGGFVLMPIASQSAPYLRSRPVTGDPRDAIDAGSDVLITDDPVAVSYANARGNVAAIPLPWTRTYALALPVTESRIASAWQRPELELAASRASLARDAVHADARAAELPYWWQGSLTCGATPDSLPVTSTSVRSNHVVYVRDDPIARGLAERLVAIEPHSVAVGLAPNDFARSLREGAEVAYVIDLPRRSFSSCVDFNDLRSRAPWLASAADVDAKLVPLIDTRETALLTRRVSASVEWSGTLHFSRP